MPSDPSVFCNAEPITEVGKRPTFVPVISGGVIFEILVATMWSVGELVASEVERSRAAAVGLGVQAFRGGSAFGTIAAGALQFTEIQFEVLTPREGRLAYAAAEWVSAASVPSERRVGFLRGLKLRLRLSEEETAGLVDLALSANAADLPSVDAFKLLADRVG